jgi:hypothetical protein
MTILNVADIQARLLTIFPEGTEQRTYLTREMAAKTVFTALYANAIEGLDRWIRPNQVCRMTDAQTLLLDDGAREAWYVRSGKNGYVPTVGAPWFADTTREPIRDETIGEGFIPVRAIVERKGLATTSSKGRYALEAEFAALFDVGLADDAFLTAATIWRAKHLSKTALARQALVASGALTASEFVSVDGVHRNVYLGLVTSGAFHVHTVPTAAIGLEASSSTDFFNEWYDSNLNSFLSELYFKSSSEGVDKYSLLSMLFDRIEGAFVSRDLVEIDKLLEAFEPSKTLDVVSVGVLRSTFRAKARLKSWQGCLARVIKHMDDSGRDWKRQLRGLINSHDTDSAEQFWVDCDDAFGEDDAVSVRFPNGETRSLSAGPSSITRPVCRAPAS